MRLIVCDTEVFAHDYLACFYDIAENRWYDFPNDPVGTRAYLSQKDAIFVGFNIKHYDRFILKSIACGAPAALIKEINDFIIVDGRVGFEHWYIRQERFEFNICDLADDTQIGTSLKSIEAHQGHNIEESEVDFNIDRPMTPEEWIDTINYCHNDVAETAHLLILRKAYLQGKINTGKLKGITPTKALSLTNAKLTAAFLGAKPVPRHDEREYVIPSNIRTDRIPHPVLDFFMQIRDMSIPSEVLFKTNKEFLVGNCPTKIAWGGIHGAIPQCVREARKDYVILNYDVASLYPSLMVFFHYISRNIPNPADFENVYHTRLKAKQEGNKLLSNILKLILNTTYGATLNQHNPLYDPLMARSICISGQLCMLDLVYGYLAECKTIEILQINTDGVMFGIHPDELPKITAINLDWQKRTQFQLEEDIISRYVARDVNTYILRYTNGKIKKKGWLTSGIAEAGQFKINNDYTIVKDALCAYFIDGTPVEETILNCQDILKFQIIAKAGSNYKAVYAVPGTYMKYRRKYERENKWIDPVSGKAKTPRWRWENYVGPRTQVQRVNRVYASKGDNGTLIKVKPNGELARIGGLPDSIVIDNKNQLTIDQIDKQWYIDLAHDTIVDFYGKNSTIGGKM